MSRFATLSQWLSWQESLHPATIDLGLERVSAVWRKLYSQILPFSVITVAGTNGKGSTVAMLAAMYQCAGYRVASYTSPHLLRYNERIVINGVAVDDAALCRAFETVDAARGDISLTYFEFGTLAALWLFAQAPLDLVILEVGLGGRLDAVNIIDADVAVITAIDLDHMEWLGTDRESIGYEKAGIMRPQRPCVCSDPNLPRSILQHAQQLAVPLYRLRHEYDFELTCAQWQWWSRQTRQAGLPRPALSGQHQLQNAAGVWMVTELLQSHLPLTAAQRREGLLTARVAGRFDIHPGEVTTVLDVAHNPAGVKVLAETLQAQPPRCGKTIAVFTALADKDIDAMLAPVREQFDAWYVAPADSPRTRSVQQLRAAIQRSLSQAPVHAADSIAQAYAAARRDAQRGDWIVVFGSFYAVADVMAQGVYFAHAGE